MLALCEYSELPCDGLEVALGTAGVRSRLSLQPHEQLPALPQDPPLLGAIALLRVPAEQAGTVFQVHVPTDAKPGPGT